MPSQLNYEELLGRSTGHSPVDYHMIREAITRGIVDSQQSPITATPTSSTTTTSTPITTITTTASTPITTTAATTTATSPTPATSATTMPPDLTAPIASVPIAHTETNRAGRVGPHNVALSRTSNLGPLMLSDGDVEVEAHCNLGSILATACVFEGKWQYEATIGTSGIQQIGWATRDCPFTNGEGVGDSSDSYAFDGNRVAKWHDGQFPYGQTWVAGDVIGCCIDLDNGNITYYRNGSTMGVAFTSVRTGLGYFPAISLSYGERCYFNFGRRPFEYPVDSYSPVQEPPPISFPSITFIPVTSPSSARPSTFLMESLKALIHVEYRRRQSPSDANFAQEDTTITASILLEHLAPTLLHEYYVVDLWYPFLVSCMEDGEGLVEIVVHWLQLLSEPFEWESCMQSLFKYLAFKCRTTNLLQALRPTTRPTNKPSAGSFPALALVLELLRIPSVLQFALSTEEFSSHLEHFITFKQPSKTDLAAILPLVWWEGGEDEPQCSEPRFLHDMGLLNACVRRYEDLVCEIFVMLHGGTRMAPRKATGDGSTPTPPALVEGSVLFLRHWLNYLIEKNKGANRNVVPPGLSHSSVLVNTYFSLLRLLFASDTSEPNAGELMDTFCALFSKATEPIADFARLGGTLGHLQKTMPASQPMRWKGDTPLEVELIDAAVMVYHLGVASRFKVSSQQQNTVRQMLARLSEAKKARASTTSNLVTSVAEELRLMNYSHAILVGDKRSELSSVTSVDRRQLLKQEIMFRVTVFLARLITALAQQEATLAYTPEYYMESMVDGFHSLRRTVPPLPLTSPSYSGGLTIILCSFIRFFNDPRIVNPDVRDLLLQSIGVLMQYNEYVTFLETLSCGNGEEERGDSRSSSSGSSSSGSSSSGSSSSGSSSSGSSSSGSSSMQALLVRGLLQAFDKKFWVTVASILLRLWKGIGIRQNTATDSPSVVFRQIFQDVISQEKQLLDTFLNNLFNTLNTIISEFSGMKLDVTIMSPNDMRKANFLMELSINLLKILEVVSAGAPSVFIQSELNMTRLVELLLLILIRTTIGPEAARLDSVLVQDQHVSRAWILEPLVNILLTLDSHSASGPLALLDVLLSDASFNMEAFNYLLKYKHWPQGSLDVRTKQLEEFVDKLKAHEAHKVEANGVTRSASMELCSICYSAPIDMQFEPCKHVSCHRCITRHLMNNTRCFFCNADVASTHPCSPDQSS